MFDSRGERLIVARRNLVSADEERFALPEVAARAELEWLSPEAIRSFVEHFCVEFPNDREPEITSRVITYLREQVSTGNIVLLRRV